MMTIDELVNEMTYRSGKVSNNVRLPEFGKNELRTVVDRELQKEVDKSKLASSCRELRNDNANIDLQIKRLKEKNQLYKDRKMNNIEIFKLIRQYESEKAFFMNWFDNKISYLKLISPESMNLQVEVYALENPTSNFCGKDKKLFVKQIENLNQRIKDTNNENIIRKWVVKTNIRVYSPSENSSINALITSYDKFVEIDKFGRELMSEYERMVK